MSVMNVFGLLSRQPVYQPVLQARPSPQGRHFIRLSGKGCMPDHTTENFATWDSCWLYVNVTTATITLGVWETEDNGAAPEFHLWKTAFVWGANVQQLIRANVTSLSANVTQLATLQVELAELAKQR